MAHHRFLLPCTVVAAIWSAIPPSAAIAQPIPAAPASSPDLAGLWSATRRFGPDERGTLVISRASSGWTADFLGRRIAVRRQGDVLSFTLPGERGAFRARLDRDGGLAVGQWFQTGSPVAPPYATNIAFVPFGGGRWRGEVQPWDHRFTLYLMIQREADGSLRAFIRNPERNIGYNLGVERLERAGNDVRLIGTPLGRRDPVVAMTGTFDPAADVISLGLPGRGGTYDFRREDETSDFWPRGRNSGRYVYTPPLARDDGWPVASLDEVDIDRKGIESFVQMIVDTPMDGVGAHEVHGILIARHGKLVLEEYFHGFDRDRLHDTRSAAKSLTATLVGAAIEDGLPVRLDDRVYRVMNGGRFPDGLDPRKRAMTLEHLLTMTSGIHCDDSDPQAPGNENRMTDQSDEPDFWRYYMSKPMDRTPGERAIYCSGDPNLAIGVLTRATGEQAMDLFDRLLARPLGIRRYAWFVSPSQQPYGGGSTQMIPRDFMKMGQLMLNRGTWNGRRLLSPTFVERASGSLCPLNRIGYGYLWWNVRFPYKNRDVGAYFAGGNGGQGVLVVPELDMVIAIFGGSYVSRVGLEMQQGYAPRYILPAVRETATEKHPSTQFRDYTVTYGLQRPAPPCRLAPVDPKSIE